MESIVSFLQELPNTSFDEVEKKLCERVLSEEKTRAFIKREHLSLEEIKANLLELVRYLEVDDTIDLHITKESRIVTLVHRVEERHGLLYSSGEVRSQLEHATLKDILPKEDTDKLSIVFQIAEKAHHYSNHKPIKGLYIYGKPGTGKSYLLAAFANRIFELTGKRTMYISLAPFITQQKQFNTDSYRNLERVKRVPLLILDDMGAESMTPFARDEIISPILQYRMENNLVTSISSNLSLEEMYDHFAETHTGRMVVEDRVKAERIMERIRYLTESVTLETTPNVRQYLREEDMKEEN